MNVSESTTHECFWVYCISCPYTCMMMIWCMHICKRSNWIMFRCTWHSGKTNLVDWANANHGTSSRYQRYQMLSANHSQSGTCIGALVGALYTRLGL